MDALRKVLNNTIKLDIDKLMQEVYSDRDLQTFILDLNRLNQLFEQGIDSRGNKLGEYSAATEVFTQGETFTFKGETRTKEAGGDIFLFDTGEFYESFKLIVKRTFIEIEADPQKDDTNLLDDFGEDIVGLTDDSLVILQEIFINRLIPLIRAKIKA